MTTTRRRAVWWLGMCAGLLARTAVAVTVDDVDPNNGSETGGTIVIVTGTGFEPGAIVSVGGTPVTTMFISSTTLRCMTPPGTGTVDVVATNPDTQSGTLVNGFTYNPPPTVSDVTPGNGPETGGTSVTITGTGFLNGAFVSFDMSLASSVSVVSTAQITCDTPPGTGTVDIMISNPDGQDGWLSTAFTYDVVPPPTVTDVDPGNGPELGGTVVTVTGTNFMNGASVKFGGGFASAVVVVSTTEITCNTPSGSGTVDVVVRNADGDSDTLSSAFSYDPPPSITSVDVDHGPEPGGTSVTITGTNFDASATVMFGGVAGVNVSVVSATEITCETPAGNGAADVLVGNPDGQSDTSTGGFTYDPPPSVASVNPSGGTETGGTSVTITGNDFVSGASVTFDGAAATDISVVGVSEITCKSPAGTGTVDIVVTNPDGQSGTLAAGFVYDAPSVINVPPEDDDGGCSSGRGGCPGWSLALLVLACMLLRKRCSAEIRGVIGAR